MIPLSAVMIAQNEGDRIARSLKRLTWADEILLIDGGSRDRTSEIAREFGVKVLLHPWEGFSRQRTFAISQAKNDWILMVDADEVVNQELEKEIRRLLLTTPEANGFWVRRRPFFFGKEVRHSGWTPDYQLRLFDRRHAEVEDVPVHEGVRVSGPLGKLSSCLEHYTVESLTDYLCKMNRYTTQEAERRFAFMTKPAGNFKLAASPLGEFLKVYWARSGFLDGRHGFLISAYSALYRLLLYAKLWHLQNPSPKAHSP